MDPRLLHHGRAARGYLVLSVVLGAATALLVVARAWLLALIVAGAAADGEGPRHPRGPLAALLLAVVMRAADRLVQRRGRPSLLGPGQVPAAGRAGERVAADAPYVLGRRRTGQLVTLATRGVDALDGYFSRYLPQLVLAVIVPLTVVAVVAAQDWLSAVIIAVTLPLIPVFMVLIGTATRSHTDRQLRTLQRLSGHFLDVVAGLPTLKVFGRSKAQVETIRDVTDRYRRATMSTLRLAFLSALVLELLASVAVALVAVSIGLRLLHGDVGFQTALLVLILAPEAYLPLRAVGTHFHASAEGLSAAEQVFEVLERPAPRRGQGADAPDPSRSPLIVEHLRVDHPGRDQPALDGFGLEVAPGEIVALTGPSGCGKSTLLSVLLGFVVPTSGTVRVGAADLAEVDPAAWRRRVPGCHSGPTCSRRRSTPTSASAARRRPPPRWTPRSPQPVSARSSPGCRPGWPPCSASGASAFRPGSASGWPWPAPSCATRRCSCSTSPRPASTARSRPRCSPPSAASPRAGPCCSSPTDPRWPCGRPGGGHGPRRGGRVSTNGLDGAAAEALQAPVPAAGVAPVPVDGPDPGRRRAAGAGPPDVATGPSPARPADPRLLARRGSDRGRDRAAGHVGLADLPRRRAPLRHPLGVAVVGVRFFALSRGLFRYGERLVGHDAAFRSLADERVEVYQHLERLTPGGLPAHHRGDLLSRVVADVDVLQDLPLRVIPPWGAALLTGVATVAIVFLILEPAALVLGATLLLAATVVPVLARHLARRSEAGRATASGRLSVEVVDLLEGAPDLTAYGAIDAQLAASPKPTPRSPATPPPRRPRPGWAPAQSPCSAGSPSGGPPWSACPRCNPGG